MKKFIALLMKEKRLRANKKMMNLTFLKLHTLYIKNKAIIFPNSLVNLFKQRFISSVEIN